MPDTLKAVQSELKSLKEDSQSEKIKKLEEKLEKEKKKKRKSNESEAGYTSDDELIILKDGKITFKTKDQEGKEKKMDRDKETANKQIARDGLKFHDFR